jgi:hypothetical protein
MRKPEVTALQSPALYNTPRIDVYVNVNYSANLTPMPFYA